MCYFNVVLYKGELVIKFYMSKYYSYKKMVKIKQLILIKKLHNDKNMF